MKGVYTVFFRLHEDKNIEIGSLGTIEFEKGLYAYTGSGGKNVLKRVKRHVSDSKRVHWHIDYFSQHSEAEDYFILPETTEYECILADIAGAIGEPVEGFGSSDCCCKSHFFKL